MLELLDFGSQDVADKYCNMPVHYNSYCIKGAMSFVKALVLFSQIVPHLGPIEVYILVTFNLC